eukprot:scaffold21899_cov63-Phaeocystis_antarctica.AAC.7
MPPQEPLEATDKKIPGSKSRDTGAELMQQWAEDVATPVDAAKDGDEDVKDEAAWAAHKQERRDIGWPEKFVADLVDMQHMSAM